MLHDLIVPRMTSDTLRGAFRVAFGRERPPAIHLGGKFAQNPGSLPLKPGFQVHGLFSVDAWRIRLAGQGLASASG